MIVVVDTSPLIALDRIGYLYILKELFGAVIRPQSVADELIAGRRIYGGSSELFDADWIENHADPAEIIFRKELGAGETAAIILAKKLNADLVLLDDLAARNVATQLGLSVSGTLGILLAAHKKGRLPDLKSALSTLTDCGFRLSDDLRRTILKQQE